MVDAAATSRCGSGWWRKTVEYVEYNVSEEKKLIVVNGLCADGEKNCETQNGIERGA